MSSPSPLLTFLTRSIQALFAIIVLGLSTSLISGHHLGSLPSTLGFVAFVGGMTLVAALIGIASVWVDVLQGQIGVLIDAAVAGINIAGGVLLSIKVAGIKCSKSVTGNDAEKILLSDIICGGRDGKDVIKDRCFWYWMGDINRLIGRCRMSQADAAFMFLTAVVVGVLAVLGWRRSRRGY